MSFYKCDEKCCANCTHMKFEDHGHRTVWNKYEDNAKVQVFGIDGYCELDDRKRHINGDEYHLGYFCNFSIWSESNEALKEKARRETEKARCEVEEEKRKNERIEREKQATREEQGKQKKYDDNNLSTTFYISSSPNSTHSSTTKPISSKKKKITIVIVSILIISLILAISLGIYGLDRAAHRIDVNDKYELYKTSSNYRIYGSYSDNYIKFEKGNQIRIYENFKLYKGSNLIKERNKQETFNYSGKYYDKMTINNSKFSVKEKGDIIIYVVEIEGEEVKLFFKKT